MIVLYTYNTLTGGEESAAVAEIGIGVCHVDYRLGRRRLRRDIAIAGTFNSHLTEDELQKAFYFDSRAVLCMSDWGEEGGDTIFNACLSAEDVSSGGIRLYRRYIRLDTPVGKIRVPGNEGEQLHEGGQLQVMQLRGYLVVSRRVICACVSACRVELPFTMYGSCRSRRSDFVYLECLQSLNIFSHGLSCRYTL